MTADTPWVTEAIREACRDRGVSGQCAWPKCHCKMIPKSFRAGMEAAAKRIESRKSQYDRHNHLGWDAACDDLAADIRAEAGRLKA